MPEDPEGNAIMSTLSAYRVERDAADHWKYRTEKGRPELHGEGFISPSVALAALWSKLLDENKPIQVTPKNDGSVLVELGEKPRAARPAVQLSLTLPAELDDFISDLARDDGCDKGEIIRRSLGLLRIAIDARREGNRVAIVATDAEVEQEIEGY